MVLFIKNNRNSIISLPNFGISALATFMLFAGLFTAKWDYIIAHTFDTFYVLSLGFIIPICFIIGVIFGVKSIHKKESLYIPVIIIGICVLIFNLIYYLPVISSVVELLKIKLNLV